MKPMGHYTDDGHKIVMERIGEFYHITVHDSLGNLVENKTAYFYTEALEHFYDFIEKYEDGIPSAC